MPFPHSLYFGSQKFSSFSQRHFTLSHFSFFFWSPFLVLSPTQLQIKFVLKNILFVKISYVISITCEVKEMRRLQYSSL